LAQRRIGQVVAEAIEAATVEEAFDEIALLAVTGPGRRVGCRRDARGRNDGGEPGLCPRRSSGDPAR